eukprot:12917302-Prorocentrum_lima.AAC.1
MLTRPETVGPLYSSGGPTIRGGNTLNIIGLQHAITNLGYHFRELDQEEIVRVAAEYRSFSRRQGESIEQALARFELAHS